ncbi:peptide chain release factor N(5)-glutamine methyltransferase [Alcanivorax sp. 24]|uniref:peptide chain release factor N(5)-glutamine methyltransferase n=1 Tax=Alcanivorax sp. 24 TaxID=2545266 RepID=UPI00105D1C7F|nr:peptide chain release factor N(5)-glutamine methyltransferase [Alcanivorax sp. 24]
MRIDQALREARSRLRASPSAALDAECLLAHVLAQSRTYLFTWPERTLNESQQRHFLELLARREAGEPVAYLIGEREFYGRRFRVSPDTLIPRPDTETLIDAVLERMPESPLRAVDLGTGTGAIGITLALERPAWSVLLVDISEAALQVAKDNARTLGATVEMVGGTWLAALSGPFELIVSNPPYVDPEDPHLGQGDVRHEPRTALVSAEQGLADIRVLADQAMTRLVEGGWLMLEHGYDQGEAVRTLLTEREYREVETLRDLGGQDRVTFGQR